MTIKIDRRAFIGGAGAGFLFPIKSRTAHALDLSNPQDSLNVYAKLVGSTAAESVHYCYSGTIYGVIPGELSRPVLDFAGLVKSVWWPNDDGTFSQRVYDVGYYADMDSGEPVEEFLNPYTNKLNQPVHFRVGPNEFTRKAERRDLKVSGNDIWLQETLALEMPNWLDPEEWPLASTGETVRFRYIETYRGRISDIENPEISSAPSLFSWSALTDWYPFMLMGQRPGHLHWLGLGRKISSFAEMSIQTLNYFEANLPEYLETDEPWTERSNNYEQYMAQCRPMKYE